MFQKVNLLFMLASLVFAAEAGAISKDRDERPVVANHAPAQGASPPEPALGVLHIPVDESVALAESARQHGTLGSAKGNPRAADRGDSDSASLGLAWVPLPAAAWLFGTAVVGIIAVSRRRPDRQYG